MSELEALQLQVAQRLGRCVMRIQRYEHLWKALLPQMEARWPPDDPSPGKGKPIERRSLGELVKKFKKDHLVRAQSSEGNAVDVGDDTCSFRMGFKFEMSPARWDSLVAPLDELVRMRNELVHHLIDRFDIATTAGCYDAIKHLGNCFELVGVHLTTLREFAISFDATRSSFFESKEFQNWLAQVEEAAQQ